MSQQEGGFVALLRRARYRRYPMAWVRNQESFGRESHLKFLSHQFLYLIPKSTKYRLTVTKMSALKIFRKLILLVAIHCQYLQLRIYMRQNDRFLSDLCTSAPSPCSAAEKFSKFRTTSGRCNNVQVRNT